MNFPLYCCYCNNECKETIPIVLCDYDDEKFKLQVPYCDKHMPLMQTLDSKLSKSAPSKRETKYAIIGGIIGLITMPLFFNVINPVLVIVVWPASVAYFGYTMGRSVDIDNAAASIGNEIPEKDIHISMFDSKDDTDWLISKRSKRTIGMECTITKKTSEDLYVKFSFDNDDYADSFSSKNQSIIKPVDD